MKREQIYSIIALVFSLWFLLAGWIWFYLLNVYFVLPFALIALFLWYRGRKQGNKLIAITGWVLMIGLIISMGSFLYLMLR
jgi:hypothetical protein